MTSNQASWFAKEQKLHLEPVFLKLRLSKGFLKMPKFGVVEIIKGQPFGQRSLIYFNDNKF